jgi:hypothetical protein
MGHYLPVINQPHRYLAAPTPVIDRDRVINPYIQSDSMNAKLGTRIARKRPESKGVDGLYPRRRIQQLLRAGLACLPRVGLVNESTNWIVLASVGTLRIIFEVGCIAEFT